MRGGDLLADFVIRPVVHNCAEDEHVRLGYGAKFRNVERRLGLKEVLRLVADPARCEQFGVFRSP